MKVKDITPMAGLMVAACFVALTLSPTTAVAGESKRNGQLHLTKECIPTYGGAAGDHCTIIASNFNQIPPILSKIFYDQAIGIPSGLLDSNVVLDAGGSNRAMGRCTLDLGTGLGLCTFSDGTGSLNGFQARLDVACNSQFVCRMDGTFSAGSKDDR